MGQDEASSETPLGWEVVCETYRPTRTAMGSTSRGILVATLYRREVDGGWLYRHAYLLTPIETMVFVPDIRLAPVLTPRPMAVDWEQAKKGP